MQQSPLRCQLPRTRPRPRLGRRLRSTSSSRPTSRHSTLLITPLVRLVGGQMTLLRKQLVDLRTTVAPMPVRRSLIPSNIPRLVIILLILHPIVIRIR